MNRKITKFGIGAVVMTSIVASYMNESSRPSNTPIMTPSIKEIENVGIAIDGPHHPGSKGVYFFVTDEEYSRKLLFYDTGFDGKLDFVEISNVRQRGFDPEVRITKKSELSSNWNEWENLYKKIRDKESNKTDLIKDNLNKL